MKAFLDTEGTGNRDNQIAQLSYIITNDRMEVVKARNYYFKVKSMNPFATRLHRLTKEKLEKLSHGRDFGHHAAEIAEDLRHCQLVCHNSRSDIDLLREEFDKAGISFEPYDSFCTMAHFKSVCVIADKHGANKNPSLKELIAFFAVDDEEISQCTPELFDAGKLPAHDSRYDAAALYLVCKTALDDEDFCQGEQGPLDGNVKGSEDAAAVTPVHRPAPIVSLAEQRKKKAREAREKQKKRTSKRVPHGTWDAPYAKYLWPFLAVLVIISLLLRR